MGTCFKPRPSALLTGAASDVSVCDWALPLVNGALISGVKCLYFQVCVCVRVCAREIVPSVCVCVCV